MIIQLRGTSGSGKTTVMREVMESFEFRPCFEETWKGKKRRQPLFYEAMDSKIFILGHYESTCGGCDNVGSAADVYNLIKFVQAGRRLTRGEFPAAILCEGLLLSEDTKWTKTLLQEGEDLRSFYLNTDVEECIERVKRRRLEAGNDKPLNEKNTRNRVAVIERSRLKLKNLGVRCYRTSSDKTSKVIIKWIRNSL